MVLDDIFSALDPATMNMIMTRLFSLRGLFKKLNTTVIIVSNNGMISLACCRLHISSVDLLVLY
jgi:ABC-type methionine transport system ATPase subunit